MTFVPFWLFFFVVLVVVFVLVPSLSFLSVCMYVFCINSFGPGFSLSTFSVLVVVNFKVTVVILSPFILHTHSSSFHFSVFLVIEIAVAAAVIQKKAPSSRILLHPSSILRLNKLMTGAIAVPNPDSFPIYSPIPSIPPSSVSDCMSELYVLYKFRKLVRFPQI